MPASHIARTLTAALLLVATAGSSPYRQTQGETSPKLTGPTIQYRNAKYGFCVSLPASWQGYSIVAGHWEGSSFNSSQGSQVVVQHGPLISIRHPLWTKENPRQDIPIMVFSRKQWDSLQKDGFHIGAAA